MHFKDLFCRFQKEKIDGLSRYKRLCVAVTKDYLFVLFPRQSKVVAPAVPPLPVDPSFTYSLYVPDQIRIWTIRVWSGPNLYTHMLRPYAYGHQRVRPNRYLDHMRIK